MPYRKSRTTHRTRSKESQSRVVSKQGNKAYRLQWAEESEELEAQLEKEEFEELEDNNES